MNTMVNLDAMPEAFRAAFNAFMAGAFAAGQASSAEPKAIAAPAATLADVFTVYERVARVTKRTAKQNMGALLLILEKLDGRKPDASEVSLERLTGGLLTRYQDAVASEAVQGLPDGPQRRMALEKGLRTSRSYIAQARSVFSARGFDLLRRYREQDSLVIPPNVREFLTCPLQGSRQKKVYQIATAEQFAMARKKIEQLRHADPCVHLAYWLCSNALRAGDVLALDWKNLQDDGHGGVEIVGLVGKNGKADAIALQAATVAALREFRRPAGPVVDKKAIRRLNALLRSCGFATQKLSHELRAKTLADIWAFQGPGGGPVAAQALGRHSSPLITFTAYAARYLPRPKIAEVLV
jgi:integrase